MKKRPTWRDGKGRPPHGAHADVWTIMQLLMRQHHLFNPTAAALMLAERRERHDPPGPTPRTPEEQDEWIRKMSIKLRRLYREAEQERVGNLVFKNLTDGMLTEMIVADATGAMGPLHLGSGWVVLPMMLKPVKPSGC